MKSKIIFFYILFNSYILGIGDRHLQNMLVSLATGKSIAIDFGYSFGSAFSLPIPEIAVSIL